MNEINFNIEETEKIDLSMDVGVKEIFPPIENLEVTPTKEQQVFTHENSYGYDKVIVEPINLQDKSITIKSNGTQEIVSDEGYDGLNQVKVITQIDGGGSGMSNYSTEETLIGTWIDGKPLYRKVIAVNQTFKNMDKIFINYLNVETMVHIGSFQKRDSENRYLFDQFYDSSNRKFTPQYNDGYVLFWITESETYIATVWIEYTKTTD